MKTHYAAPIAALAAVVCLSLPAHTAPSPQLTEFLSYDGLKKINVRGLDLAYARPGATLAGYKKVIVKPILVAFAKNWNATPNGSVFPMSQAQRDQIKANVANLVHDSFTKALVKAGYPVVTAPGPDVLLVQADVINLYVNTPAVLTSGMSRTFSVSAGQGTLVIELSDSETGQILARAIDTTAAQAVGPMLISNSVTNRQQALIVADRWASILVNGLNKAHDIGKR